tara:strand:+ start:178 stop:570 length:393 start_codon:yes stop_codon:yes gene_type:complete
MRTFIGAVKSRIAKGKIPIKSVVITAAEGPTKVVNRLEKRKFRTLESASEALKPLVEDTESYINKVFFTIRFDDGEKYEGRTDLNIFNYKGRNHLRNHVNTFINNVLKEKSGFWVKYKPQLRKFKKKYAI